MARLIAGGRLTASVAPAAANGRSRPADRGGSLSSSGMDTPGTWRSWTITEEARKVEIARTRPLAGPAPHPGEILKDELEARGLTAHALALALRLPASLISQIVRGGDGSRRKLRPASPATSAALPRSGFAFRLLMTSRTPKPN